MKNRGKDEFDSCSSSKRDNQHTTYNENEDNTIDDTIVTEQELFKAEEQKGKEEDDDRLKVIALIDLEVESCRTMLNGRGSAAAVDGTMLPGEMELPSAIMNTTIDNDKNHYTTSHDGTAGAVSKSALTSVVEVADAAPSTPATITHGSAAVCYPLLILWDVWASTAILFQSKSTWLLALGPVAVMGSNTKLLGEAICFCLSGVALIPCAERLSFVTEILAEHTNGTIGALLNATFGNAPELLITIFALRSGYYRVVQLAMLGSMLTNMTLVFGAACLIGGLRWHVQDLRLTSGNVNVGMLLLSTAGMLFPAALVLSGQLPYEKNSLNTNLPTPVEVAFCRVNAFVMITLYVLFLVFTIGSHKDEFDDAPTDHHHKKPAKRNLFCLHKLQAIQSVLRLDTHHSHRTGMVLLSNSVGSPMESTPLKDHGSDMNLRASGEFWSDDEDRLAIGDIGGNTDVEAHLSLDEAVIGGTSLSNTSTNLSRRKFSSGNSVSSSNSNNNHTPKKMNHDRSLSGGGYSTPVRGLIKSTSGEGLRKTSDELESLESSGPALKQQQHDLAMTFQETGSERGSSGSGDDGGDAPDMSMAVCIVWLFIITLCISALTDILVDTIDGFAQRMGMSEVFTSMVIVPFFSNVAEQISAFIFAWRNEMDLCVGVTVGSAIQIATFVLPASVLMGMVMDRSMTLYFHGYETVCMFFAVVTVAAVLQGGSTNWLVGAIMIAIYVLFATGIWFHEFENLTMDEELAIRNVTGLELYQNQVP